MKISTLIFGCGVAIAAVQPASSQSLETRIASGKATVGFEYPVRRNICGNGASIYISDDTSAAWTTRSRRSGTTMDTQGGGGNTRVCEIAPARVVLTHSGKSVTGLRVAVGGREHEADTELGTVDAQEAAMYLLAIAPSLTGGFADKAVMGAAIAEGLKPWRRMIDIARNNEASEASRKASLFWVSQEAGTVATAGLSSIALDDDAQSAVRSDALFFLSQRKGEGIPALIRVARESKSAKLRKDAIWYLSQSKDPRAIDLFEQILAGR